MTQTESIEVEQYLRTQEQLGIENEATNISVQVFNSIRADLEKVSKIKIDFGGWVVDIPEALERYILEYLELEAFDMYSSGEISIHPSYLRFEASVPSHDLRNNLHLVSYKCIFKDPDDRAEFVNTIRPIFSCVPQSMRQYVIDAVGTVYSSFRARGSKHVENSCLYESGL